MDKRHFLLSLTVLSALLISFSFVSPQQAAAQTQKPSQQYLVALTERGAAFLKPEPKTNRNAFDTQIIREASFFLKFGMYPIRQIPLKDVYLVQMVDRVRFMQAKAATQYFRYIESNLESEMTVRAPKQQATKKKPLKGAALKAQALGIEPQTVEDPEDNNWSMDFYYGANVRDTWNITVGDSNEIVAILGTGVDLNHSDLLPNLWKDPSSSFASIKESRDGFNVFNTSTRNPPQDSHGITTHAAGIIGAKGNNGIGIAGVAWNVKLMPVRVISSSGNTLSTDVAKMVEGINYVIMKKQQGNNVTVIYNFWNFPADQNNSLRDAITAAGANGILFVTAAGDSSRNLNTQASVPGNFTNSNLISVASYYGVVNPSKPPHFSDIFFSSFSNYGNARVHLAAPGEIIRSCWIGNSYNNWAGTVDSAAHVAGVAVLVKAVAPTFTPTQIKDQILNHVRTYPTELSSKVITQGVLDAYLAVSSLPHGLQGDFDGNGWVDGGDFLLWQRSVGLTGPNLQADGDKNGVVNGADLAIWQAHFGEHS